MGYSLIIDWVLIVLGSRNRSSVSRAKISREMRPEMSQKAHHGREPPNNSSQQTREMLRTTKILIVYCS